MKGLFITFEGADGSGKTTQAQLLAAKLQEQGYEVVLTREPGGTAVAEGIRQLVLDPEQPLNNTSQTLLYLAARSEHVEKLIAPALKAGKIVICDRFCDSTMVYQGLSCGATPGELERLQMLNDFATGGLSPHLTFVLDGDPQKLAARRSERGVVDRYELQGLDYQLKLRLGFWALAATEPQRMVVINADGDLEQVAAAIAETVASRLQDVK